LKPEAKFYAKVKKTIKNISWIRLENNSLLGTPDLLGYNNSGHFFTVELKVCKGNKIRFSPQASTKHFYYVQALGPGTVKLFRGSRIMELDACGFKLDACCLGLDACRLMLEELGA
jgi:hypothetical protein